MSGPSGYYFVKVNGQDKIAELTEWGELVIDGETVGAPLPLMHPTPITPAAIEALQEIVNYYRTPMQEDDILMVSAGQKILDILQKHNLLTDK